MNLGAFAVAAAVGVVLLGLAVLANAGRPPRRGTEVPANLSPYQSDAELESRRLNRVLGWALIVTIIVAISLPIYFLTESGRQEAFAEEGHEEAIAAGEVLFNEPVEPTDHAFGCSGCHGAAGVGGAAEFIDPRTGETVTWAAPPLNDVLYRYSYEETEFWVIWGRAGSPMPAWGLEAGGPLNDQEVEEIMAYIESIQLPQGEVAAQVDVRVDAELDRLEIADANLAERIAAQQDEIATLETAPENFAVTRDAVAQLCQILDSTDAAFVPVEQEEGPDAVAACVVVDDGDPPGPDRDQDQLGDVAEVNISRTAAGLAAALGDTAFEFEVSPTDAFTNSTDLGEPIPDLESVASYLDQVRGAAANFRVQVQNQELLLAAAEATLAELENLAATRPWAVDFQAVADQSFGGDVATAERAFGLYSAYCARCHTAGYSAGPEFTREPGSGAFGPSLRDARSVIQFPDADDHIDFIINGSEASIGYGVNGIGRGWMPGFGAVLSEQDIALVVEFERGL